MNFRGVSLAAGMATRLRPLTTTKPKAALPVLGIPSLYFAFMKFRQAGLKSWAVNTHYLAGAVDTLISNWPHRTDIHTSHEREILGSGGCYGPLKSWSAGHHLVIYNPDIVTDFDLNVAVNEFERRKPAALIVCTANIPAGAAASVHLNSDGDVVGLGGDRTSTSSRSAYGAGIFILSHELVNGIGEGPSSLAGHINRTIKNGGLVRAMSHDGFWVDLGDSIEHYYLAQQILLRHLIANPSSGLAIEIDKLWQELGLGFSVAGLPKNAAAQTPSLIDQRCTISPRAKIGPGSFIFGQHTLDDDLECEHCIVFAEAPVLLPSIVKHCILIDGRSQTDLPIQRDV